MQQIDEIDNRGIRKFEELIKNHSELQKNYLKLLSDKYISIDMRWKYFVEGNTTFYNQLHPFYECPETVITGVLCMSRSNFDKTGNLSKTIVDVDNVIDKIKEDFIESWVGHVKIRCNITD